MTIGERISSLRKEQKLSQGQLADSMGVSRQAVSKWENDQSVPDPLKMIQLAQILDTDIEHLSTGREPLGRRPPVVINTVETVERIVEKPVVKIVEKPVVQVVEKIVEVPTVTYVEKPLVKRVFRTKYVRNPLEYFVLAIGAFLLGLLIGSFL